MAHWREKLFAQDAQKMPAGFQQLSAPAQQLRRRVQVSQRVYGVHTDVLHGSDYILLVQELSEKNMIYTIMLMAKVMCSIDCNTIHCTH